MSKDIDILESAENYIKKHDEEKSVEELFIEFQNIVDLHEEFEKYLKVNKLNENLEKMKRNERSLARRKLFSEWYSLKSQNVKKNKEILIDLSEMCFISKRRIENVLFYETTENID